MNNKLKGIDKKLILDTSIIIPYYFGFSSEKLNIQSKINQFNNFSITSIIKMELRNIYDDCEKIYEIINDKMDLVEKNQIPYYELFAEVSNSFSEKYYRKQNMTGRLHLIDRNISSGFIKDLFENSFICLDGTEKDFKRIMKNRVDLVVNRLKRRLLVVFQEISSKEMICDFKCALSSWKYTHDPHKDVYSISPVNSCVQIKCNFTSLIKDYYISNKEIIDDILKNQENFEQSLIVTLNKIREFFKNNQSGNIRITECKKLGDFFISMIVDENSIIYTKNYKHFLPLLRIRGLESNILFEGVNN